MKVRFGDLEDAFCNSGDMLSYWVDRKTGKVILISDDVSFGEFDYADEAEVEAAREIGILCGEIEAEDESAIDADRYVEVVPPFSSEKWKWMEEFTVDHVENEKLQDRLADALRGRKPFARFKDVLLDYAEDRDLWFAFENEKMRREIEIWAKSEGLEIDFTDQK